MAEPTARARRTARASALVALLFSITASSFADTFEIVLRVNERIATSYDYQLRRAEKIRAIQSSERLSAERKQRLLAEVGVSTMGDIFEELLVLSRADQLGIEVSPAEIDRAVETTKRNYGLESEEEFEQALRSSGMNLETLRGNMRKNLLIQKVMGQEVQPRVKLEEEDLRRYYQSHSEDFQEPERLRLQEVVLLDSSGLTAEELRAMAEEIREQLLSGGDLEAIVQPYAERQISSQAVDLGWVEAGDLDAELEAAVWGLETGQVSQPIAGRGGIHVMVVVERSEAYLRGFAEVEQEIRAREGERLLSAEMQKYLEELEARAYVVANPPPEAAGFEASLSASSGLDELATALTAPLVTESGEPAEEAGPADSTIDEPSAQEPPSEPPPSL